MHNGLDLLDESALRAALDPQALASLRGIHLAREIPSTNQYLLDSARQGLHGPYACLAEYQTMGRGRRGNVWVSPFASGLCMSLLWRFERDPRHLAGLSLAIGVTLAESLESCGVQGIALKWPNDLYWSGRKLGGLLIELVAQPNGITHCVIGIGINVRVPVTTLDAVEQPWVDLASTDWNPLPRSHLAGRLLSGVLHTVEHFETAGLAPFLQAWRDRDWLLGQSVCIEQLDGTVLEGIGAGIEDDGTLRLDTGGQTVSIVNGHVRLSQNATQLR